MQTEVAWGWGYWEALSRWGLSVPIAAGGQVGWFLLTEAVTLQLLPTPSGRAHFVQGWS